MSNDLVHNSRYLSKLLRHDSEDLIMDSNGWILVKDVLSKLKITKEQLAEIVADNDKKRFTYNPNQTKIRANQGHSVDVDVELKEAIPPTTLYHGTSSKMVSSIMSVGLKPMKRKHVHLSHRLETAIAVGNRHTKGATATTAIIKIDSEAMSKDEYKFYLSENGVWLIDYVPVKYLKQINYL